VFRHAEHAHEVARRDDGDAVVDAKAAKIAIARHDDVGAAGHSAFEEAMVIGVTDGVEGDRRRDQFPHMAQPDEGGYAKSPILACMRDNF